MKAALFLNINNMLHSKEESSRKWNLLVLGQALFNTTGCLRRRDYSQHRLRFFLSLEFFFELFGFYDKGLETFYEISSISWKIWNGGNVSLQRKTLKASSLEKSRFLDKKYLDVSNFYEISVEVLELFFLVMTLKKSLSKENSTHSTFKLGK